MVDSFYKIFSKVAANRLRNLRNVVGKVVLESQSVLVKGRQILKDILTANELVDYGRKMKFFEFFLMSILRKLIIRLTRGI